MSRTTLLGFGSAAFVPGYGLGDAGDPARELTSLLQEAVRQGIRYIDTATDYGESQRAIGTLADTLRSQEVRLCTKVGTRGLAENPTIVTQSLQQLCVKGVDTLLLHSARLADLSDRKLVATFCKFKEMEQTRRLGASTYGIEDARWVLSQSWCDVVQVEHSILNPSVVGAIAAFKRSGQELVVRSVLCKGLLTGRRRHASLSVAADAVLDNLTALAQDWGFPLEELAIRFALDTKGVDVVLVGMARPEELRTALAASARPPLEAWQLQRLAAFDSASHTWSHPEKWPTP